MQRRRSTKREVSYSDPLLNRKRDEDSSSAYSVAAIVIGVILGFVVIFSVVSGILTFKGYADSRPQIYGIMEIETPVSYNYSFINKTHTIQIPFESVSLSEFGFSGHHLVAQKDGWYSFFGNANFHLKTNMSFSYSLDVVRVHLSINDKIQSLSEDVAYLEVYNDTVDFIMTEIEGSGTFHDILYLKDGDRVSMKLAPLSSTYFTKNSSQFYEVSISFIDTPLENVDLSIEEASFGIYSIDK